MVWAAWLVGPPELVIATTGAVVSSVEAQRGGAGVAKRIGLARHDGVRTIGQPARRVNDHAPCAVAVAVGGDRLPSIVKCTTVLARPVPLSASIGGD